MPAITQLRRASGYEETNEQLTSPLVYNLCNTIQNIKPNKTKGNKSSQFQTGLSCIKYTDFQTSTQGADSEQERQRQFTSYYNQAFPII